MRGPPADDGRPGAVDDGLAALLEDSRELLMVLGARGTVRWLSPAADRWLGPSVLGRTLTDLVHRTDAAAVDGAVTAVTDGEAPSGRTGALSCRLRAADGGFHAMELSITDRRDHPRIAGLVCVARHAAARPEVAARLIHEATHDTLTALPNRSLLLDRLSDGGEHGGHEPCAVLYLDLDRFKAVNDSLGHAAGDRVLVTVADRLRRTVRPGDTVARLHGDEFVVVAAGVSDTAVALDIAERIVGSIRRPIAVNGRLVTVSASIGVALGPGSRASTLLEEADRAMFGAKDDGRNRCAVFSVDMRTKEDDRQATARILREALDDERGLALLYQPLVELRSGRLAGVEATLRVRRPDGTLIAPTSFMDIAEATGLAVAVGSGLLDLACRQQALWREELGRAAPGLLTVPTTLRQLCDERAADRVAGTLGRHGVDPATVCLVLPEGSLSEAGSDVVRTLELLKGLGLRLAADGFGNGRFSLSYLRRFGIDLLRMDGSLMAGIGGDGSETEIVRALIGLGGALGMTVVATGVETAAQADLLAELGCDLGQGCWFGPPATAEESPLPTH